MTYRFPVVTGDRVALAPHTDLWMMGLRFGTVTGIEQTPMFGAKRYLVRTADRVGHWLWADDMLGAVNAVPGVTQ